MIGKKFILAGRAIFTVSMPHSFVADMRAKHPKADPPKDWYTFKVVHKPATDRWPEAYFINLLSGADNSRDYSPLGRLNPETGAVALVKTSRYTDNAWPVRILRRVVAAVWADQGDAITAHGFGLRHEGRCGRCGRRLTVPSSIDMGLGPECASY